MKTSNVIYTGIEHAVIQDLETDFMGAGCSDKGIEFVFEYLPKILDSEKVCQGCRDKSKCQGCAFSINNQNQ